MLQTKWIVFLTMTFILGNLLSGIIEQSYLGTNGGTTVLAPFVAVSGTSVWDTLGNIVTLPIQESFYTSMAKMFTWDYAFFTGGFQIVQYILCAISVGMGVSITFTVAGLIRGSSV
jgi:hypothetical protein